MNGKKMLRNISLTNSRSPSRRDFWNFAALFSAASLDGSCAEADIDGDAAACPPPIG